MRTQGLLSILLLCVLLLQAWGGQRSQRMNHLKAKACTKRPKEFTCENHCSYFQHCPQNTVCCSAFCGNVCMNIL
ncbi:protein WFDC10B-like [Dama dama]|uniref:protein WFDC10B n=1 Tax=Dama dama TaxID=30532 RepID=UPI002A3688C6|nr:protein WFDC10B [Dama dama]